SAGASPAAAFLPPPQARADRSAFPRGGPAASRHDRAFVAPEGNAQGRTRPLVLGRRRKRGNKLPVAPSRALARLGNALSSGVPRRSLQRSPIRGAHSRAVVVVERMRAPQGRNHAQRLLQPLASEPLRAPQERRGAEPGVLLRSPPPGVSRSAPPAV